MSEEVKKEMTPAELAATYPHFIQYDKYGVSIRFSIDKQTFYDDVSNLDVLRYLKMSFGSKERFSTRFTDLFKDIKNQTVDFDETVNLKERFPCDETMNFLLDHYDEATPFSYAEAFALENQEFQSKVFGVIDIVEMITELGHERLQTAGKRVKHKQYTNEGEFTGYREYDVVYETHQVNGEKLGLEDNVYALRCWCTSTDEEHWLWIEDEYKDDPLAAVASTCRVHKSVKDQIKEIKRQGDIFLVELNDDVTPEENEEMVPLTTDEYFGFLSAQS